MSFDCKQLIPLIRRAGEMILAAHTDQGDVTAKPGSVNFVTVHDVRVQNYLIGAIRELLPNAAFIAEEKENDPTVLDQDYCFIIDPIDGTTNFIYDMRHSCISVALVSRSEPVFGAIYNPYQDELFYAIRGKGAFLNGKPIHVSDRPFSMALVGYGTSPYCKDTLSEKTFSLCRALFDSCADVRRCGSAALDLAYLAVGRYDVFFELSLSPWDIAAGYLLITEAGGVITDETGALLNLSRSCSVIAATPTCFPALLDTVKKYL